MREIPIAMFKQIQSDIFTILVLKTVRYNEDFVI